MIPGTPGRYVRVALAATLVTLAAVGQAHADAWQLTDFTSPAGKPSRGLVTNTSSPPGVRMAIGCELPPGSGWRGIALWRTHESPPTGDVAVVVSFFGRTPVKESWHARSDGGREVLWAESSESLRRNLLREDGTRGEASVTFEIHDDGPTPQRLEFKLEGLSARSAQLAAACDGWGAAPRGHGRDRGW